MDIIYNTLGVLHQQVPTTPPGCPWLDGPTTASLVTLTTRARRLPAVPCPGTVGCGVGASGIGGGVDRPTHYQTQVVVEAFAAADEPPRRELSRSPLRSPRCAAEFAPDPAQSQRVAAAGRKRVSPALAQRRKVREEAKFQVWARAAIWHAERAGEAGMDVLATASHGRWELVPMHPHMYMRIRTHMRMRA